MDRRNYRLGPIDQFGHKTPTWDWLRNVNLQIHALAPTLITLRSVNLCAGWNAGGRRRRCKDANRQRGRNDPIVLPQQPA